jgi:RNA polymerase sigma factor (sigma-70 family)
MSVPLRKTSNSTGKSYQRRLEVEELIEKLESTSHIDIVKYCTNHKNKTPTEVILYFIRHSKDPLSKLHFEQLFTFLFTRLSSALNRLVPDSRFDKAGYIRQEMLGKFAEIIASDRNAEETKLDYFEVNFNSSFARFRIDVLRQIGPARENDPLENSTSLTGESGDYIEVLPKIEKKVLEDFSLQSSKLNDPSFRLRFYEAINSLPENERQVIGLLLQGMPIESKDLNNQTISTTLGCAVKTVNNRLNRAYNSLKANLLMEEEL